MGSESQNRIQIIDLSKEIERGSQEWIEVSKRVREACEDYGCFEVICEQISSQLREEIFSLTNKLYLLPMEIKKKNTNSNPFMAYASPNPVIPLLESFGIEDASNYESIKGFAQLMMADDPLAEDHFCKTFNTLVKPLHDLHQTIRNLIVDSYGIGDKPETVATMGTQTLLRMMKYKPPPPGEDILGAYAHTDKPLCTLLCQDECTGLEIATKDGQWFQWLPTHPNSFIFNVGDPLMAWSNGRLHSMKHRVSMKGDKERHSIAAFLFPVKGAIIKPEEELIDDNHPPMFKEFVHSEYLKFCNTKDPTVDSDQLVYKYAGI
ncbi:probable 2-oxoglutarate-dependent dioxygenase AOP1 [Euphorbia lathyris]|uniref:probable 2-oxoglutarate-dependent dioxygenase AOP1 n=1 Tax=Euphorbia lathyris TaxID=212925 RepID=UPI0033132C18